MHRLGGAAPEDSGCATAGRHPPSAEFPDVPDGAHAPAERALDRRHAESGGSRILDVLNQSSMHSNGRRDPMLKERYGDIAVTLRENVVEMEIQRPPNNFFDHALIRDLADALGDVDREPEARVTMLCSQGKSFCAGANFANRQASVLDSATPRGRAQGVGQQRRDADAVAGVRHAVGAPDVPHPGGLQLSASASSMNSSRASPATSTVAAPRADARQLACRDRQRAAGTGHVVDQHDGAARTAASGHSTSTVGGRPWRCLRRHQEWSSPCVGTRAARATHCSASSSGARSSGQSRHLCATQAPSRPTLPTAPRHGAGQRPRRSSPCGAGAGRP
jgi:hypothetical protein